MIKNISRRNFLKSGAILAASTTLGLNHIDFSWAAGSKNFLTFSDIHFNPFQSLSKAGAAEIFKSNHQDWLAIFQEHGPKNYGKLHQKKYETNWKLLDATYSQMQKTVQSTGKADFILFTGDFLAHSINKSMTHMHKKAFGHKPSQDTRDKTVRELLSYVSHSLDKYLPGVPIYFCLGNNDSYYKPTKTGHWSSDYTIECNGEFLRQTEDIFYSHYLKNNMSRAVFKSSYTQWGAYSLTMPDAQNQLISLNTNLLSYKREKYLSDPWKGANEMLDWFAAELETAKKQKYTAWVIAHIPPGSNGKYPFYHNSGEYRFNDRLLDILEHYTQTIRFISLGHTHMDDFRVNFDQTDPKKSYYMHITPAISPQFGNNPCFTSVAYNDADHSISGISYKYFKFPKAGKSKHQDWQKYSFQDKYPDAGPYGAETLHQLWENMKQGDQVCFTSYANHYDTLSPCEPDVDKHPTEALYRIGNLRNKTGLHL